MKKDFWEMKWLSYQEEAVTAKLTEKGKVRSFRERNWQNRQLAYAGSYLLNMISLLGAAYGMYWLFSQVIPWHGVSILSAGIVLWAWEGVKRVAAKNVWYHYFFRGKVDAGWVALTIVAFAFSAASSTWGAFKFSYERAEREQPAIAAVEQDTTFKMLNDLLAQNRQAEQAALKTTWKGKIVNDAADVLKNTTESNKLLFAAMAGRIDQLSARDATISADYWKEVQGRSWIYVAVFFLFEIGFQVLARYVQYVDFRGWIELTDGKSIPDPQPAAVPVKSPLGPADQFDPSALILEMKRQHMALLEQVNNLKSQLAERSGERLPKQKGVQSDPDSRRLNSLRANDKKVEQVKQLSREGMSQRQIAEQVGLSVGTVNKYLRL